MTDPTKVPTPQFSEPLRSYQDRYLLIDAHGVSAMSIGGWPLGGYRHRPAAIRSARHQGFGVWDRKEEDWLLDDEGEPVLPDPEGRLKHWLEAADSQREKAEECDRRAEAIQRVIDGEAA